MHNTTAAQVVKYQMNSTLLVLLCKNFLQLIYPIILILNFTGETFSNRNKPAKSIIYVGQSAVRAAYPVFSLPNSVCLWTNDELFGVIVYQAACCVC